MAILNVDLTGQLGLAGSLSQETYKTTKEVNLNYNVADGEMADGYYNPLMRPGYLYPANNSFVTLTMGTNTFERFTSALADPNSPGLIFGNSDEFVYRADNSFTIGPNTYVYQSFDSPYIEQIRDTTKSIIDMAVYEVNGVRKIFFCGDGDVGILNDDSSLSGLNATYLSTTATNGDPLSGSTVVTFLRKADNGLLYIFDEYTIHALDGTLTGGTNGTATMNVLTFPEDNFIISDAVDTRGKMFICLQENTSGHWELNDNLDELYVNNCGVYIWNRISGVVSMQDYISVESCMFIERIWVGPDGNIFLMTIGTNGNNQVRIFDGSKFTVVKEMPTETRLTNKNALTVAEGMTWWAAFDGNMYAGKFANGRFNVFKIAQYSSTGLSGGSDSSVALVYSGADSYTSNSGYRKLRPSLNVAYIPGGGTAGATNAVIKRYYIYGIDSMSDTNSPAYISPNPFTFVPNQGDVYTGVQLLPTMSTVKNVTIRCIPTTTGSTTIATIKYYFNNSSTAGMTKTITLNDASKGYVVHSINKPYVNSIQIEIEWNTANVMGVNDFAPYLATIDYQATSTNTPDND